MKLVLRYEVDFEEFFMDLNNAFEIFESNPFTDA